MTTRVGFSMLLLAALCVANAQAGTILVYAVNWGMQNKSPQNVVLGFYPPPNIDSFLDVWVKTDIAINGMSLDVFLTGNAITITSVIVQNPLNGTNPRWGADDVFSAIVAPDGKSALGAQAATLSSGNRGMNPANAVTDLGYDVVAGAFHFARVNFHTGFSFDGPTTLKLGIGANDIGTDPGPPPTTLIYLGATPPGQPAEPAACSTEAFDCAGATSLYADSQFFPEPASATLLGLALLGLVGCGRPQR